MFKTSITIVKLFPLLIIVTFFLNGCTAKVSRLSNSAYPESSTPAYIWHKGYTPSGLFEKEDIGLVVGISEPNSKVIPKTEIRKGDVTEVPAGEYRVQIYRVEKDILLSRIICDLATENNSAFCITAEASHYLTFTAEEDHLYLPFTDDECNSEWVWIEDWGSAKGNGAPSFIYLRGVHPGSGVTPNASGEYIVVAGERPPEKCP